MKMNGTFYVPIGVLALSIFGTSQSLAGQPVVTETYNIKQTSCEGLDLNGVVYSFTVAGVPSLDCQAGTYTGPGRGDSIQHPNIEGTSAGVLHMRFDVPTAEFGFGVAQNTFNSPQVQSVIVDLFRPGVGILREEVFLDTTLDPNFVGARYDYSGPAVRTVTVRHNGAFSRFAIDNVTYFQPPGRSEK